MAAALEAMRHGKLVSDDLVLAMVAERSGCLQCQGGFILDGFPRTVKQAEDFEALLTGLRVTLDAVISYELSLEGTVLRSAGRLTCPRCHAVYHRASKPPKQQGFCDVCGAELKQREDDRPEAVRTRLREYSKLTEPLVAYYHQRGLLVPISADGTPDEIFQRTVELLQSRRNTARPTPRVSVAAKPSYT
jgi:adenylate kinase